MLYLPAVLVLHKGHTTINAEEGSLSKALHPPQFTVVSLFLYVTFSLAGTLRNSSSKLTYLACG